MINPKAQLNLRNAKDYFREHLCVGEYYAEGQQVTGEWFGLGADQLGLKGKVGEAEFLRLCEGLHPKTGERLTQRMNINRHDNEGRTVANRRVFYDFTISPPKSVSVVALLSDDRILGIHHQAVKHAMTELEKFAETRVRKSGERGERVTANVVAAAFLHDTSRDLDPHIHTHCVVLNATFDPQEKRWKALEVQGMYQARKFAENVYYHELSKGLRSLGYEIENDRRAFEIKGVQASVVTRFSKRHEQIDREARQRIAEGGGNVNTVRRHVQRDTRKRKISGTGAEQLRPSWLEQLTKGERTALDALRPTLSAPLKVGDVAGAVSWADEHLFERRSVVHDFELLSAALARGRGEDFDLAALREAVDQRGYIRQEGTRKLTSPEVLRCELDIVMAAKYGRGQHEVFAPGYISSTSLLPEQKVAAEKILQSRNFIALFRGGAGTGKSFTLKEVQRGLLASGRPVVVLAPQRQQVRDLQADGLQAETLASFLQTKRVTPGAVVIVDEAGQIGGKQLRELIQLVQANAGRIILSGDTRQHGAVAASDALRAIEKHSGIKPAVIQKIRRQDPKQGRTAKERGFIRSYRAAVKAASKGKIGESFDRLEKMGCIRELPREERREMIAEEFVTAVRRGEKTLVVAQTREEVREVNEAIRQRLRTDGKLGEDKTLMVSQPLDLGDAEKRDPRFYLSGQKAFFLKSYGRFKKGDLCEIASANEHGVVFLKDGRRSTFSYRYTDRIVIATAMPTEVAVGDRLQLKFSGKSAEGTPINNGELVTVRRMRADGGLIVEDDGGARKTLGPQQRLFTRGYAVTSYGSQGKTVDTVIVADAASRAATNSEQWYVSISRGRKRALIFTSDVEALRGDIERRGSRELALDLKENSPANKESQQVFKTTAPKWKFRARAVIDLVRRRQFINNLRPRVDIASRVGVKL